MIAPISPQLVAGVTGETGKDGVTFVATVVGGASVGRAVVGGAAVVGSALIMTAGGGAAVTCGIIAGAGVSVFKRALELVGVGVGVGG